MSIVFSFFHFIFHKPYKKFKFALFLSLSPSHYFLRSRAPVFVVVVVVVVAR